MNKAHINYLDVVPIAVSRYIETKTKLHLKGVVCFDQFIVELDAAYEKIGKNLGECIKQFNDELKVKTDEIFDDTSFRQLSIELKSFILKGTTNMNVFSSPDVTNQYLTQKLNGIREEWDENAVTLTEAATELEDLLSKINSDLNRLCLPETLKSFNYEIDLINNQIADC